MYVALFFFSYCMVCDNEQNLGLPHFGAEQPADIYYFLELTVNIFGIADVTARRWFFQKSQTYQSAIFLDEGIVR